tara:strand:+ start:670 stop:1260 length:591 start_codon:yes stop_codon:yes gene_type:complete
MATDKHSSGPIQRQEGWVLIIGLVLLAMLSTLGISLMQNTRLEEKMASASREINLSFQAAETAIREAEAYIEAQSDVAVFDNTGLGIYAKDDDEQDVFDPASWIDDHSKSYGFHGSNAALEGVGRQPRYMIKKIEVTVTKKKDDCVAVDDPDACPETESTSVIFRITARGTGGSEHNPGERPSSQTLLRTYYGKSF